MKTIGPLHFEDLEPHRFEDLVRQLAYDFRPWRNIEAVGRLGADGGIDIRATDAVTVAEDSQTGHEGTELELPSAPTRLDRTWLIQCKREGSIGSSKLRQYVSDTLDFQESQPYGLVLAAACDFSKKSRDAFLEEVANRGVGEFYLWGKAELEDMLFRPQNDHLLFAYFGISLQIRRRSTGTRVRSNLALKRLLVKHLGEIDHKLDVDVLVRDPQDDGYPYITDPQAFLSAPRWRYWRFWDHDPVDHLSFVAHEHYAYFDPQTEEWDALLDHDLAWASCKELYGVQEQWERAEKVFGDHAARERRYHAFWSTNVPQQHRCILTVLKAIPFDRILGIDDLGDRYNRPPHLLVEYTRNGPFESDSCLVVNMIGDAVDVHPEKRITLFPNPISEIAG